MKEIDISWPLYNGMAIYPGNPPFEISRFRDIPEYSARNFWVSFGSHNGTHVDAQSHVFDMEDSVDKIPLERFYGRCQVIDLTNVESEIDEIDLEGRIDEDILLMKTRNSYLGHEKFDPNFVYLNERAAEYIVSMDVKTLGFDYLSVKKKGAPQTVHKILLRSVVVIEGLNLKDVEEGKYKFIGFPLNIIGCDGAPLRAVLIEE